MTPAFGESLTGYDFKYMLTLWLVNRGYEAFSVAEAFLKEGIEGVGEARLFVSHVQRETIFKTLLIGDDREDSIPEDVCLWLDYVMIR